MLIKKYNGRMSSRERVQCTLRCDVPDRVPVSYATNPCVHGRLEQKLGLSSMEEVLAAIGADSRHVGPQYTGPVLFPELENRQLNPVYGFYRKWVPNMSGGYWEMYDFPLKNADADKIAAFPVPDPDHFDYETAAQIIKKYNSQGYAIGIGGGGTCDLINLTGRLMGMENTLVNFLIEDEATLCYVDRRCNMDLGMLERLLERCPGEIDFLHMGEDLGTQHAPMISMTMYRKVMRPRHQKYIDLAKSYGKPVMVHTCGCSSWVYEDFIEMGVSAVETLQPEAANMSPEYLKKHFGGRLAFHGCISTAGPLAFGSPEDVDRCIRETLEVMMPGGGYWLAPTHMIQDNTPVDNIIAMYNAAHKYGVY